MSAIYYKLYKTFEIKRRKSQNSAEKNKVASKKMRYEFFSVDEIGEEKPDGIIYVIRDDNKTLRYEDEVWRHGDEDWDEAKIEELKKIDLEMEKYFDMGIEFEAVLSNKRMGSMGSSSTGAKSATAVRKPDQGRNEVEGQAAVPERKQGGESKGPPRQER